MNVQTGRLPYECRGRAWDDVTINQGSPKVARKPPEPRGEAWVRHLCGAFTEKTLSDTLLLTETLRTKTGCILCSSYSEIVVCGSLCYQPLWSREKKEEGE